ncbi:MAG TPA: NADH-quinone oxidoreductase subunit C, partial [Candidatus Nanopelagicales bacterium]|nr:NADH-quinone oxidoreductase subunit C [Candidatus Nanopelagicales bacterium]
MIVESDIQDVEPEAWVIAATGLRDAGLVSADWLSAVDRGGKLEILLHLCAPGSGREALVRTVVSIDSPRIASLVSLFPGVNWHERETAEMFGVEFQGRSTTEPLLLRTPVDQPPLRRDSSLPERVDKPWPGAQEKE